MELKIALVIPLSSFFIFSLDLSISHVEILCGSPATNVVLNLSGFNTSCAQAINHQRVQQTDHLLMKKSSHEFLSAFI